MIHSLLITGSDLPTRIITAEKHSQSKLISSPDILIIQPDKSIGIKAIRNIEKFLSRKPYQADKKIIFIPQAETLTLPAQNALLKTLEEPPAHSLLILTILHSHLLIPTIISRCQVIKTFKSTSQPLSSNNHSQQQQTFNSICKASIGEKINISQQSAFSKESAIDFCEQQIAFIRQQKNLHMSKLLRCLSQTINYLQANVNPKTCLENLVFHYSST